MENLHGHRKIRVWQNLDRMAPIVNRLMKKMPRASYKLIQQIYDAFDSSGSNFVEGYYSGSIPEYLRFLRYGKRSLAEVQERIRRCFHRGYFSDAEYFEFEDLAIKTMYLYDRLIYSLDKKLI